MATSPGSAADHGALDSPEHEPGHPPRKQPSTSRSSLRSAIPLALVCLTLLGSVAIPARQTWLITRILRQTIEGLAPARLIVEQLQSGLAKELVVLQSYAISGDDSLIGEYRATATADDRRVAKLQELAQQSGALSTSDALALERRVRDWRHFTDGIIADSDRVTRTSFTASLERGEARYDSTSAMMAMLATYLASQSEERDDRVDSLEQLSIASNAGLVLAAMVAMAGVLILTLRERKLTAVLQRSLKEARGRARREAALREAAEALAGAYTMDEVTQRIAHAALQTLRGRGAFVAQIAANAADESPEVVVKSVMGADVLPLDARRAFAGSYTERVTGSGESLLVEDLVALEQGGSFGGVPYPGGSAIVIPLNDGGTPIGALFVLSSLKTPFRPASVARAEIFAHLATLAYEKVRLLEQAHERRRVLERVVQSRSRLMRGFSHDVKNPIGAADGFAELLSMGVYGDLTEPQLASIERMRRSIHAALALIDDLHELSRAETGSVALSPERVDLAELARTISEEYHAAAAASGLSLSVKVEQDDTVVETDRARVRQIAANLLSNAIKYTDSGSVEVRVRSRPALSPDEDGGWALLEFADSGIGIAADKQSYIFEEFSRLHDGDRVGAGLGLAISKLLAQALGGRISVESEVGAGSTFTLWLPLVPL